MWFVEHVVYGEGLYFLEFDELQIKEDQMNGHVTGGYTLCRGAVQRFGESQRTRTHTHTPITICGCMNAANLSFIDTHIILSVDWSSGFNKAKLSYTDRQRSRQ